MHFTKPYRAMSRDPSTIFPERLREARLWRDLSQTELAKLAKLRPAAISHFETGSRKPSFDNLRRLADALRVTTDYLLGRSDVRSEYGNKAAVARDRDNFTVEDLRLLDEFEQILRRRRQEEK